MSFDLQSAINNTTTGFIQLPYSSDVQGIGNVVIPDKPLTIQGCSPWGAKLRGTITCLNGTGVRMRGFRLEGLNGNETGIILGKEGVAVMPILEDLVLANLGTPMRLMGCCLGSFRDVYCVDYSRYGVAIANIYNGDQGDNTFTTCKFDTSRGGLSAFFQESSGGLNIHSCKILQGDYAYIGAFNAATSDLSFVQCSIEGQKVGAFKVDPCEGFHFDNVIITGCQLAGTFDGAFLSKVNNLAITATAFNMPGYKAMILRQCTNVHILNNPISAGMVPLDMR